MFAVDFPHLTCHCRQCLPSALLLCPDPASLFCLPVSLELNATEDWCSQLTAWPPGVLSGAHFPTSGEVAVSIQGCGGNAGGKNQRKTVASWSGVLIPKSQKAVERQLQDILHLEEVSGLLKDDGRRVSLCVALVKLAPSLTLMHPIEVEG